MIISRMMNKRTIRCFIAAILLITVSLAARAQQISSIGCRRGAYIEHQALTRGAIGPQTRQAGGDFYKGERHQLVVLVQFADKKFSTDKATALEQWDKLFNQPGYNEDPFVGSVHDYFLDQSYGKFSLQFDLQYIDLNQLTERYKSTNYDDENSQYLVADVIDTLITRNIDWGKYDWNDDGFVNQLMIIYAGKGMNDGGGSNSIWPHQWWYSLHYKDHTAELCQPLAVPGKDKDYYIDCYCALQEIAQGQVYGSFGTICHEYAHCFGIPDYYYDNFMVVGSWDLMDYGNNNGSGFCPPGFSAHERWIMGWLDPVELTGPATVTGMEALCDAPQAYLIRNDSYENEYYIVENRQKKGWDKELPGSGIMVFHIDFDEGIWTGEIDECVNSSGRKRYTIFPASNKTSVYNSNNWGYPYLNNDILSDRSKPASTLLYKNNGTGYMGKPLSNMSITDSVASFSFMEPAGNISVVEGIWYTIYNDDLTARVAMPDNMESNYTDTVIIPQTIVFQGDSLTVTGLGRNCFMSSNIKSLDLPISVTHIDKHALYSCNNLNTVTIRNQQPPTVDVSPVDGNTVYFGNITLRVPRGSLEAYQSAPYWNQFSKIVEFDSDPTAVDYIITECPAPDAWYDITGMRLKSRPTRSGLYIHNGKKVIIY